MPSGRQEEIRSIGWSANGPRAEVAAYRHALGPLRNLVALVEERVDGVQREFLISSGDVVAMSLSMSGGEASSETV